VGVIWEETVPCRLISESICRRIAALNFLAGGIVPNSIHTGTIVQRERAVYYCTVNMGFGRWGDNDVRGTPDVFDLGYSNLPTPKTTKRR
jgi:hypothetical protein